MLFDERFKYDRVAETGVLERRYVITPVGKRENIVKRCLGIH